MAGHIDYTTSAPKGTAVPFRVTVTSTPVLVLAANVARINALFINDSTTTLYLSPSSAVTSTGANIPLAPGASFVDDATNGAWYAVSGNGAGAIAGCEVV